jgi:SprT-like family
VNKNARDLLISLVALAVIVFGVRYHIMRERLRHADLHSWYQQDNAELFGGKLPDGRVKWSDLSEDNDEGKTYQLTDDSFVILLDPKQNTSEDKTRDTLRHEACHVATWGEEPVHGPKWQACMSRRID